MCVIARLMTNDGDNGDVVDDDDGDADDDGYGREIEEYDDDYGATDDAGDLTYLTYLTYDYFFRGSGFRSG